jgi:2-polyprenyl-3-methyl-5-hydroxy-6-metoxy-1,4-benzoquinol methylase
MSEQARLCVICGGALARDPVVHARWISLHRCLACGSAVALPRPSGEHAISLHDSDEYFEHPYFGLRRTEDERTERRCKAVAEAICGIVPRADLVGARHLDVGCDTGIFARVFARLHGSVPIGLDVNAAAIAEARRCGVEAYQATLETAPALRKFRVITAIDLIEHVAEPLTFFASMRERLEPNGVVFLQTPNFESIVYSIGRGLIRWAGGRPRAVCERLFLSEHIQYFSPEGLSRAAESAGLEVVRIGHRFLETDAIAASPSVRAAMSILQTLDQLRGREILTWAVLRRAAGPEGAPVALC